MFKQSTKNFIFICLTFVCIAMIIFGALITSSTIEAETINISSSSFINSLSYNIGDSSLNYSVDVLSADSLVYKDLHTTFKYIPSQYQNGEYLCLENNLYQTQNSS